MSIADYVGVFNMSKAAKKRELLPLAAILSKKRGSWGFRGDVIVRDVKLRGCDQRISYSKTCTFQVQPCFENKFLDCHTPLRGVRNDKRRVLTSKCDGFERGFLRALMPSVLPGAPCATPLGKPAMV